MRYSTLDFEIAIEWVEIPAPATKRLAPSGLDSSPRRQVAALHSSVALCWEKSTPGGMALSQRRLGTAD